MRQPVVSILLATLIFSACQDNEKSAQAIYNQAYTLYSEGNLAAAKRQTDSIALLYPKEFATIRKGQQLIRKVTLSEQERNLAFIDSLLPLRTEQVEALKPKFYFELDTAYQKIGDYVFKLQKLEKNVQRCYIRAQTNEDGEMQLASVYYGAQPINHTHIKLTLPDGTYVETAKIAYDGGRNYRFEDMGVTNEVVTYKEGADNGAIELIATNSNKRIKVNYEGGRPYIIYMDAQAKESVATTLQLSQLLSEIKNLKREQGLTQKKIEYLTTRIAEKEQALNSIE